MIEETLSCSFSLMRSCIIYSFMFVHILCSLLITMFLARGPNLWCLRATRWREPSPCDFAQHAVARTPCTSAISGQTPLGQMTCLGTREMRRVLGQEWWGLGRPVVVWGVNIGSYRWGSTGTVPRFSATGPSNLEDRLSNHRSSEGMWMHRVVHA